MLLLLIAGLLPLALSVVVCPSGIKNFAAEKSRGPTKYWTCAKEGRNAVLRTCPRGKIYSPKYGMCRSGEARLEKRSASDAKNLELLELEAMEAQQLGVLYNARTGKFEAGSYLWDARTMQKVKVTKPLVYSHLDVFSENNIDDRAYHLNVEANLKLAFCSGLIEVSGAAKYLRDEKKSANTARVTMAYKSSRLSETVPITTPITYPKVCTQDAGRQDGPTHVVTSLVRGLRAFMRFDRETSSTETVEEISGQLSVAINAIPGFKGKGTAWVDINGSEVENIDKLNVMYHGDAIVSSPTSYIAAIGAFKEIQEQAPTNNAPVKYQLTPLSYLCSATTALLADISDDIIEKAGRVLVELDQTKLEARSLRYNHVSDAIPAIRAVLDTFLDKLDKYTDTLKMEVRDQLVALKGGAGNEAEFVKLLGEYDNSPFSASKSKLFLQLRAREISTIELIMTEATKHKRGKDVFVVADYQNADDVECIYESTYSYTFAVKVLPDEDTAQKFIATGDVDDESKYWYNDLETVGKVGAELRNFIAFGLANAPKDRSDNRHCFLIQIDMVDPKNPEDYVEMGYYYPEDNYAQSGFIPPIAPPKPECTPYFDSVSLKTAPATNKFVKKHYIVVQNGDNDPANTPCYSTNTDITALKLEPNTEYNITTKYKLFNTPVPRYEDVGFSPSSPSITCTTAPTSPVRYLKVWVKKDQLFALEVSWTKPSRTAPKATIEYVLKVRQPGQSDAESIIKRLPYTESSHTVEGLDASTKYEVLIYTESEVSASSPVQLIHSTAPAAVPFPEVVTVTSTSITLVEKVSMVDIPTNVVTKELVWRLRDTTWADDRYTEKKVVLAKSRADKTVTFDKLTSGKSYQFDVQLVVLCRGSVMYSTRTEPLLVSTAFGGDGMEQVESQFNKIKQDTETSIAQLDKQVDVSKEKVQQLTRDVSGYLSQATVKVGNLAKVSTANFTIQEEILKGFARETCVETGYKYVSLGENLDMFNNVPSIYYCLDKCRDNPACKGVTWNPQDAPNSCFLKSKRRGSYLMQGTHNIVSANLDCYTAMSSDSSKWAGCVKQKTNFGGADITSSTGFDNIYDCARWCLSKVGCKSVTLNIPGHKCWLKSKPQGNSVTVNTQAVSLSIDCLLGN